MNISKLNHQMIIFPIFLLIMIFILWASLMRIGEFVRGQGKITPSGQVKKVQHLEGGIISEILVQEGDIVHEGQILYRIRNEFAISSLSELQINLNAKLAAEARLNAELSSADDVQFPREISVKYPNIVDSERKLFFQRRDNFRENMNILEQQSSQRKLQLQEEQGRIKNLSVQYQYAQEQQTILERLVNNGAASQKELIDSKIRAQGLLTDLEDYQNRVQTTEQSIEESIARISEAETKRKVDIQAELSGVLIEIERLREQISANTDRVDRNEIVSPVDGVVQSLTYNTVGGIIRAGDVIAEIIPSNDNLIIEARVAPQDRPRIYPGQKVNIRIHAYSSKVTDNLQGVVTDVSADTFLDEGTRQPYYAVRVESNFSGKGYGVNRPIYPGMTAEINIEAGQRTVMQYILNPILRVFDTAFREP